MEYECIIYEKKDHIATITLNRPERLNAMNPQMMKELEEVFYSVEEDDETRVVVITGAGRGFCAGADIQGTFQAGIDRREKREEGESVDITRRFLKGSNAALARIGKPLIASINGLAIGAGFTNMALLCDIRIASEAARISLPFAKFGIAPTTAGASYYLPRLIGIAKALELVFTGKTIDAREAKEIGLVNEVVPADELAKVTYEMASTIAKLPPLSMRVSKRLLYQGMNTDIAPMLQHEAYALNYLTQTEDHKEAVKAFTEKREPVYKGR